VTALDIRSAIRDLDLAARPVCLHSSLRSFGRVDGGAGAVIDAFLAEGCTLTVPTFSSVFAVPPPHDDRPARNGWDYSKVDGAETRTDRVFTPEALDIDGDMGVIPRTVLSRHDCRRGNHPLDSFSAVGPLAETIVEGQTPSDVYAPFRQLARFDGRVVLAGVGLESMTLLHQAEQLAGRNLFIRWARDMDGRVIRARIGSCSNGFPRLDAVLAPLERSRLVGSSNWRVFPIAEVLETASRAIREQPSITRCDWMEWHRCDDAILGGPQE
jgi:aminoglycoside N3'-acetyltransferase